jgi:Asp-tRNA(Asn)/Glu-tRNA(Gln) amidotransferase A subunit family amidase
VANEYFARGGEAEVFDVVAKVARALGSEQTVTIPAAGVARAAAFIITASEGSNLHLEDLRQRPQDFDPATRDRFLAGALIPANWYLQAQRWRQWYRDQVRALFQQVDIILAPAVPCVAPPIGQTTWTLDGVEMLVRPNVGLYTQPLSFIGLPIVAVPIHRPGQLPLGVQIIGAPYQEALVLRVAAVLEAQGIAAAPVPSTWLEKL